jgi:hypothetical protein
MAGNLARLQSPTPQGVNPKRGRGRPRKVAYLSGAALTPGTRGVAVGRAKGKAREKARDAREKAARPVSTASFLDSLAELIMLTREHGGATVSTWHEIRERDQPGTSRIASDRHWERLKLALIDHGVPHTCRPLIEAWPNSPLAVSSPTACVLTVNLSPRDAIEKYANKLKRCVRAVCGKRHPARPPYFYKDSARPDGLDPWCCDCRRVSSMRTYAATNGREKKRIRYHAGAKVAAQNYRSSPPGILASRKAHASYRANHIERLRASNALGAAVRSGKITRGAVCAECGWPPPPPQICVAWWKDYSAPLDVEWVCQACHYTRRKKYGLPRANVTRAGETVATNGGA